MASPRSRSSGTPTPLQRRGAAGEDQACAALMEAGLVPVARNVRYRSGEIDLIMREPDGTIVFVEVRFRAAVTAAGARLAAGGLPAYGGAAASVGAAKQRRIVFAARCWLARQAQIPPCRFDVVALDGTRLQWLKAAFDAS